jgi:hypothetical protein
MKLEKKLGTLSPGDLNKKAFVGFDGFEDKIQKVVRAEKEEETIYFATIADYAKAVERAAGKSSQFQLHTHIQKLGGNAPIMAHSLGNLGIKSTLMASLGYPEIRPVFKSLHPLCSPVSVCSPGETNALEFNDGKLILSEMTSFKDLHWKSLMANPGKEKILEEMNSSDLIALVDWSNLVHCSDIWRGIQKDILPSLEGRKKVFFDIADPSRSSKKELEEVLGIISGYSSAGEVYFGINENETFKLYELILEKDSANVTLHEAGQAIFDIMEIEGLLIHPTGETLLITANEVIQEEGKIVQNPMFSTGGGDNFNAGFCLGLLLNLPLNEAMKTGMATSGFYVKNGKSPSINEIGEYITENFAV